MLGNGFRMANGDRVVSVDRSVLAVQGAEMDDDGMIVLGPADGSPSIADTDAAYARMELWTDVNHDGVPQPVELRSLQTGAITKIYSLFRNAKMPDARGNVLGPLGTFALSVNGVAAQRELAGVTFAR